MKTRFEPAVFALALVLPVIAASCDGDSYGDDSPTRGDKNFEGSHENLVPGSRNHPAEDGDSTDSGR